MQPKDPLLALMFSFIFPGLGQIYSGRVKRGAFFLMAHLSFIGAWVLFMFHPTMQANKYFLVPISFFFIFEIFVILDAYLYVKKIAQPSKRSLSKKIFIPLATVFFMFIFNVNTLLALVIRNYIAPVARVRSNSMRPKLIVGDWFLINKRAYKHEGPERGDIVFFDFPRDTQRVVVKRIIAKGGETVEIRDGNIYINNRLSKIPNAEGLRYYNGGKFGRVGQIIKVPIGYYYVLGDNNTTSIDSRYWGFVPEGNIIGKAHKIIYPFERSGPIY